jgi:hypothetical protein
MRRGRRAWAVGQVPHPTFVMSLMQVAVGGWRASGGAKGTFTAVNVSIVPFTISVTA